MTLNQVKKVLSDFATNHKQIDFFGFGDVWELDVSTSRVYPLMWVELQPSQLAFKEFSYNFKVYFAAKVLRGEGNETEVLSDMTEIAKDLYAHLYNLQNSNDYEVVTNTAFEYFTEAFDDMVAGCMITLQIKVPNLYDYCQIPD